MLRIPVRVLSRPASLTDSPEVARAGSQPAEQLRVIRQPAGDHMYHLSVALDHAIDAEQVGAEKGSSLLPRDSGPDDDIDVSGLILKRCKDHTACRRWTLPIDDEPPRMHAGALRAFAHAGGRRHPSSPQVPAQQGERMAAQRQVEGRVIGDQILPFGGHRQQRDRLRERRRRQERRHRLDAQHPPPRLMAVGRDLPQSTRRNQPISVPAAE